MARWRPLENLLLDYRREGRGGYLAAHPHPVLVVERIDDSDHTGDTGTQDITSSRVRAAEDLSPEQMRLLAKAQGFRVLTLVKCEDNDWPDRITLGRSRINDLVLPHATISKVHAYFTVLDDGRATLTDAGSRNGTRLNDARLKPEHTATLEALDKLTFGSVTTTYHPARNLCDFLALLLEH